jgi:hypothetical protein
MNHILGVLVDRYEFSDPSEFSWLVWESVTTGPPIVQPKRFGTYEPLKPIADLPLEQVVGRSFFFSNGRKSNGAVFITRRRTRRFYNLTLDVTTRKGETDAAECVYRWLETTFPFTHCYLCSFTNAKTEQHPKALQLVNVGVFEPDLPRVLEIRFLFEHFESVT